MTARSAVSEDIDEGIDDRLRERLEAHLESCSACRAWRDLAHVVTRRTRVGVASPSPMLAAHISAAVHDDAHRRRVRRYWLAVARAVVIAGLLQLLATVPLLVLARSHTAGGGRVHLLGMVELAIGAGFFIGAVVVLWQQRDSQVLELVRPTRAPATGEAVDVSEVA